MQTWFVIIQTCIILIIYANIIIMAKGKKTGGRQKGTPNKVSSVTKEMVIEVLSTMHDHLPEKLAELEAKDYVAAYTKLAEFVLPKPQRVEIEQSNRFHVSIEDTLRKLSQDK